MLGITSFRGYSLFKFDVTRLVGCSLSQLSVPKVPHLEGKPKVWLRSTVLLALHPMCRLRKQFWEAQLRKANLTWSYNIIWYIWSTVVRSCPDIYFCLRLGGCYIEVRSCLGFHGFPIAQIYQIPADPSSDASAHKISQPQQKQLTSLTLQVSVTSSVGAWPVGPVPHHKDKGRSAMIANEW